jgi:glyoxylase-like metal-dependent hydrolase (beta-lactamase superfamily II)
MKRIAHRIGRLLFVVLGGLLAPAAWAATELAPGVTLLPGHFEAGEQPDGNSVILRGKDGLVIFDTGRHPAHTQGILDFAHAAHLPVVAIVNSHWHLDHIGGNAMLRQAFPQVRIYASAALGAARSGFLARYRAQLEEQIGRTSDAAQQAKWRAEIALIDAGDALAPDEVVTAPVARSLAGRPVRLGLEDHAVTAGDVWLFDAETRVLAVGDLVTLPVPFLDTACAARWEKALDRLAAMNFVLLVPGHGSPMDHAQLDVYRRAFANLRACAATAATPTACAAGWQRDAHDLLAGEAPAFVASLAEYYVTNSLRADAKHTAALCGP